MPDKPQIPRTDYLPEGQIQSKWVLSVKVPHPESSGCLLDNKWYPSVDLSLSNLWELTRDRWEQLQPQHQKILHDIINVLNDSWGCEEIDGATRQFELQTLLATFTALQPDTPEPHFRLDQAIALLKEHQACSNEALLEMEWGW